MKIILNSLVVLVLVSCTQNLPEAATPTTKLLPSQTLAPTQIPTDIPLALLSTYTFPAWVNDPHTNLLAALVINESEHTRKVSLFNAATGEKYDILMPPDISGYFWYDNANLDLLSNDLKTAYKINLQTGRVSKEQIPAQATRLLDKDWSNGVKLVKDGENTSFTLEPAWSSANSKTARFTAERKESWAGILVTDNLTNKTVWELNTPEGEFTTEFAWSPVDNNILAYTQGKLEGQTDFVSRDVTLNLVDILTGKIIANYPGDFGMLRWSPDGTKILYQDSRSMYHNYGIGFTKAPCILFLNSGEIRCLKSIPHLAAPQNYSLASTGIYSWADNETIFFTYLYLSEKESGYTGKLCKYSLTNGQIDCPIENMDILKGRSVANYEISPDQQFIYFCYSASSLLNDYADLSNDGIIKIDGTGFFSWTGTTRNDMPDKMCSPDTIWRPLP